MNRHQLISALAILTVCGTIARADDARWLELLETKSAAVNASSALSFSEPPPATPLISGDAAYISSPGHFVHNRDSIPDRPPVIFEPTGRYERTTRAAVGGDPGSVAVTRAGVGANLIFGPEHDLQVSIPVDYETSTYSFRLADDLFPGGVDRVRSFEQWVITPNVEVKINDHWGVFGGGLIFMAGQYDADRTITYGGFGGAIWRPDKTFTLRFGIGARTRLEDEIQVLPALWMEWRLDDRTRLTSQGNNIRFEYDFHEAWCVKFDAAMEQRSYRLDNDGPGPGAVFKDSQVPLTARIEFVPHAAFRFEAWIGCNISREFIVDLKKDDRFSKSHASPSLIYGIQFDFYF